MEPRERDSRPAVPSPLQEVYSLTPEQNVFANTQHLLHAPGGFQSAPQQSTPSHYQLPQQHTNLRFLPRPQGPSNIPPSSQYSQYSNVPLLSQPPARQYLAPQHSRPVSQPLRYNFTFGNNSLPQWPGVSSQPTGQNFIHNPPPVNSQPSSQYSTSSGPQHPPQPAVNHQPAGHFRNIPLPAGQYYTPFLGQTPVSQPVSQPSAFNNSRLPLWRTANYQLTGQYFTSSNTQLPAGQYFTSNNAHLPPQAPVNQLAHRQKLPDYPTTAANQNNRRNMAGKKSAKALSREEGLERTDNGMKTTSWSETQMINQKNYYTDFMKRDEQQLAIRLQNEANRDRMVRNAKDKDRALALNPDADGDLDETGGEETVDISKIIIIHPGSQNLRIGLASDALPKAIPMALAAKWPVNEAEESEPRPKRQKMESTPDQQFGAEFSKKFGTMSSNLKVDMRANKRKVLPNSKELVVNYNRRTEPEKIPEHNDPMRIEWTDYSKDDHKDFATAFAGMEAMRVPDDSKPRYKLFWPLQHGRFNENEYESREHLFDDFELVLNKAIRNELGLKSSVEWEQYSCVFVIPDLYDKAYVEQVLHMCMKEFEFKQVAFFPESLAATFGAGYTSACIVDIGAQTTSISCVEDGMIVENSRINLKYGGYDVTETFMKMMLHDSFPYADINLKRRYDFLLAEELKINFCTLNQADISVQLYNFHLRAPNQPTHKYQFKTYDEVILAPMGFYDPTIFDNSDKLLGRHKLVARSYNDYDTEVPDDPMSTAQLAILESIEPSLVATANGLKGIEANLNGMDLSTPSKEKSNPFLSRFDETNGNSRVTSAAGSPAPEGTSTPVPPPFVFGANGNNRGSPGPGGIGNGTPNHGTPAPPGLFVDPHTRTQKDLAGERDAVLPIAPLDAAILTSIMHAAGSDEKKVRDFVGGIMLIGGGAKTHGFGPFLEERLKQMRPDLADKILVGTSPREMDGQVVVWKGASVFGQLATHESWIGQELYERHGSRCFKDKLLWAWF